MDIYDAIVADPENQEFTQKGWKPIYTAPASAKILIIGQAPSMRVQKAEVMWKDASGDRLREWLGVDEKEFYDSGDFGVIPMDFYYPGKAKSGDKAPRKGIAKKWHPELLQRMPNLQLIILIGAYSQRFYLKLPTKTKITDVVADYQKYLPKYFPIVHPSPRNNIWMAKNPWFATEVIPALQKRVAEIIKK
ncbi:uracil-DNA glycosylase family protein [Fructilactobacillus vespulae]|uniref:uracil-DNA glycosylase family protein n=1 Tax=Fructilactobacillus vespulae TaxID=1249630 RepID=UPI0039B3BD06